MSTQFNWDFDEEDEMLDMAAEGKPWWGRPLFLIITLLVLGLIGLGGWVYARNQLATEEEARRAEVQTVLDQAHDAYAAGDGRSFFATQSLDPAWQAIQLQPQNQQLYQDKPVATRAELLDDVLLVNATWPTESEPLQRILFFQWQGGRLVQIPNAPGYWGTRSSLDFEWGNLLIYEIDTTWQQEIGDFVTQTILDHCSPNCNRDTIPFTLVLDDDYQPTAVSNDIHVPSPRLIGLTEEGEPSQLFWQQLEATLIDRLTPATLRFAIPQTSSTDAQIIQILTHLEAAQRYMDVNPDITIEIVALDSTPDRNLADWLALDDVVALSIERVPPETTDLAPYLLEFDGVAMSPTPAMLSKGLVHDLTDYTVTDPDFDESDFYEQVWQGILWRDRVWMVPRQATMQLVYYDQEAYATVGMRPPETNWTWDEMGVHLRALTIDPPVTLATSSGYVDPTTSTLFAYAYNWNNNCEETATVRCGRTLTSQDVTAALNWYQQLTTQPNYVANLAESDPQKRLDQVRGWQITQRTVATWVDEPHMYENYSLNGPVGVLPFPGSGGFDGVTPLEIQGGIVMQTSERPFATWQWLKFLSYHESPLQSRHIPARPSVATSSGFWTALPPGLGDTMRNAFPFARPIMLAEQQAITWEKVLAVTEESVPAEDAAQSTNDLAWFLGDWRLESGE
ncbi:MAG: ABC transporter substrate-binding protein [Chloroflexota bacterium]